MRFQEHQADAREIGDDEESNQKQDEERENPLHHFHHRLLTDRTHHKEVHSHRRREKGQFHIDRDENAEVNPADP